MRDPWLMSVVRAALGQNETMATHAGLRVTRTNVGVALAGEVDAETWGDLSGALRGVVRTPPGYRIVVDLAELSFIDAHGARLIAEAADELRPPTHLSLIHAPPGLIRIADILELRRRPGLVFEGGDAG